ncbi:serine protease notopleural [Rhodnius prolixus]|uniref:serine protease notopleural n=1 Tax=Rhodnius prolixus TaxID=13249 RepID=UPI003D187BC6
MNHYHHHGICLILVLFCAISRLETTPLRNPQNIGRNIRHLPCVSRRTGEQGTCMFAFSCAKLNGTHLGTCIDRFYFGSCCKVPEEDVLDIVPPLIEDNSLMEEEIRPAYGSNTSTSPSSTTLSTTTPRIRPAITQKPSGVPSLGSASTSSRPSTTHLISPSVKPSSPIKPSVSSYATIATTTSRPSTHKPTTVGPTLVTWTTLEENKPYKPQPLPSKRPTPVSLPSTHAPTTLATKLPSISSSSNPSSTTSSISSSKPTSASKPQISTIRPPHPSTSKPSYVPVKPQISTTVKPLPIKPHISTTVKPNPIKPQTSLPLRPSTTNSSTKPIAKPQISPQKPQTSQKPQVKPLSTTVKPLSTVGVKPVTGKPKPTTHKPSQPSVYKPSSAKPQLSTVKPYPVSTAKPSVKPKPPPVSKPTKPTTVSVVRPTPSTTQPSVSTTVEVSKPPSTTWVAVSVTTHEPTTTITTDKPSTKKPIVPSTTTTQTTLAITVSSTARPSLGTTGSISSTSGYYPSISSSSPLTTNNTTSGRPTTTTAQRPESTSSATHRPIDSSSSTSALLPVSTLRPPGSTTGAAGKPAVQTTASTLGPSIAADLTTVVNNTSSSTTPLPDSNEVDSFNMTNFKEVCGRRLYPEARIVGGQVSGFGKWPWQISLRQWRTSTYLHKCGAALLNENWAITAAHCVENVPPSDLLLRLGEHDLSTEEEPYGYQERRVQIVASHPQFDPRTFEYDLALLRFYEPVTFQPNIIPVCVPEDDTNFVGSLAFVTGWGRLYEDGPLPSILQEVSVPVINNTLCETMYRAAGYIEHIPEIFICAGWKKGGFDSCEGDSGGPMVIQRPDRRWLLAGVISWGIGCAEPNQPGVYTRISQFRHWINQILQF